MTQTNPASGLAAAPQPQRFLTAPRTQLGKWSVALGCSFAVLFLLNSVLFVSGLVRLPRQETWGPFYAMLMVACGLAAGGLGLTAIIRGRERSWAVWLSIMPGVFMVFLLLGEFLVPH